VAPRAVSLNFASWRQATADMPAFARRVLFDFLPAAEQASCWEALRAESDRRTELERRDPLLYDEWPPPKRLSPHHGTPQSTSTGAERVQLETVSVEADPGQPVSAGDRGCGRVVKRPVPLPDAAPSR
jgi:hypothetical protein